MKRSLMAAAIASTLACAISTARAEEGREKFIDPASVAAPEAGQAFSFSTRVGLYSDYIWRGVDLYKGVSIQPSVGAFYDTGQFGTFGASVWMAIPGENKEGPETDKFFELDTTVSYDYTMDILTLSAGHIWYTDPGYGDRIRTLDDGTQFNIGEVSPDTAEFYWGASLDLPLQPQFTMYIDYRTLEYQYYALNFSQPIKIAAMGEGFNLTPFVTFGFASDGADDIRVYNHNGLEHINVGVTTDLKMGKALVRPSVSYCFGNDTDRGTFDLGNGETFSAEKRSINKFFFGVDFVWDFGV